MSNKAMMAMLLPILGLLIAIPVMAASKGSITISVAEPMYVSGHIVKPGACQISWQTQSPEADVTIRSNGDRIQVRGRVIERDSAASTDQVVVQKDAEGREVLKEVRLRGKRTVLLID
jgi:hypothetical protein